jgi:hypothetical protein
MTGNKQGGFITVDVSSTDVNAFRKQFPCSRIPEGSSFIFELDSRNGDLVNITMYLNPDGLYEDFKGQYVDSAEYDGAGLLALSCDATNYCVSNGMLPQWAKR